jgi:hypothetical protein
VSYTIADFNDTTNLISKGPMTVIMLILFSLVGWSKKVPIPHPSIPHIPEQPILLSLQCNEDKCQELITTYRYVITAKMFIDELSQKNCEQSSKKLGLQHRKSFVAFCRNSSSDKNHIPMYPSFTKPPNARITAQYEVEFKCELNCPTPIEATISTPKVVGGKEAFVHGVPFPSKIENTITTNGQSIVILGGHPHKFAEPALIFYKKRTETNVWIKSTAQIHCHPDESGFPSPTLQLSFDSTDFPTQKVWVNYNNKVDLVWQKQKGLFSELWTLPAIPNP